MYKSYLNKLLLTCFVFITFFAVMNYIVDPYGYNSREGKFIKNLSMFNKPHVASARLNSDGFYYLIGTSRVSRINPKIIEDLTGKNTHNIKIDGSTLSENLFLAKEVKNRDKNFIYGFDAFSLNKNRLTHKEIYERYSLYKEEFNSTSLVTKYFNSDITIRSIQHILKLIKGGDFNKEFINKNSQNSEFTIDDVAIDSGISNNNNKKNFSDYTLYPDQSIIELAKVATKDDIFVVYPKHYYYYDLFSKNQDIEKKYLSALRLLAENTKAKVWVFYGKNYITQNKNNFNDIGWHFKPKISNLIFSKIFNNHDSNDPFGFMLDDKVNDQLNGVKNHDKE